MSGSVFQTERLNVRTWRSEDLPALAALLQDEVTMAHWPEPFDSDQVQAWFDRAQAGIRDHGCGRWCCTLATSGAIIGDVGIMVAEVDGETVHDLGYIIDRAHWRKGYAYEAASGAIVWARDAGISSLIANMAADNLASIKVAEKIGMQRLRTFVNPRNLDKETLIYRLDL